MKNLTAILCLTLALFILSACGDYEKGAAAYKEGNHATALNVFQPLAENKGFLSLFYSKEDVINAQFNLGVMYEIGQGVPQDDKTAVKWYRLAAEQGHAGAQSNLKILQEKIAEQQPSPTVTAEKPPTPPSGDFQKGIAAYESGDYATALREWKPLAEQGNADAQVHLGGMYTLGKGVPKDYKTAVKWYRLAAEQGHADAQSNLGAMYALKQGVVQDNIYAHMWGHLGASNGNETGGKVRDFVEKKMTPADISTAQKLARECVRKKYKGC